MLEIENKSSREVDKILLSKSDDPEIHFKEKIVQVSAATTSVTVHLDEETITALSRLKELWSHADPHSNFADTIKRAAKEAVESHDPLAKIARAERRAAKQADRRVMKSHHQMTSAPKSSKAQVKQAIWKRDQARCTFMDPRTGERCNSRYFIEEDHVKPKATGGEYSVENIRIRCRAHNQRHAIDFFGREKMQRHLEK